MLDGAADQIGAACAEIGALIGVAMDGDGAATGTRGERQGPLGDTANASALSDGSCASV
jgi:hypothetical protein